MSSVMIGLRKVIANDNATRTYVPRSPDTIAALRAAIALRLREVEEMQAVLAAAEEQAAAGVC